MTDTQNPKVAQVGCGYWGKNLVRNYAELGALAAICDTNPDTYNLAETYGVPVRPLDEVLNDPAIAGVSFATPAETHADLAIQALQAGKHVYVEKPLALTSDEAQRMITAAEDTGKTLMVGHLLQYHPIFCALRDLVAKGELGTLRYIYSNRLSLGKFRTEEDVLWSFAPHDISMILSLAGGTVTSVTAHGSSFVTPGIGDVVNLQMQFDNGLGAHVFASWSHPFKEQRLVVIGDKAMAAFEDSKPDWDQKLVVYDHQIDTTGPVPVPTKAEARAIPVPKGEPLKTECQAFLDAIASGHPPPTDGAEGLAVLTVLEQASAALRTA